MNRSLAIAGVVIKEMYRRKDFYVLLFLTALLTIGLGAINFFNDPRIVRYLKEVCLLCIWICSLVICITTAARQIPAEKENRTIFPLLAKPVSRWEVILGKFLGCWFACGIALLMFYLFFAVVSEARGHGSGAGAASPATAAAVAPSTNNQPAAAGLNPVAPREEADDHDGDAHEQHHHEETAASRSPWINYLQALWLHWMMLGVVTAMVVLGSVVFAAPSSTNTICFISVTGIILLGEHLNKVALRLTEPSQLFLQLIYFLIPHLEWFDIRDRVIYDHPPIPLLPCALASLYAVAYAGLFLFFTWLRFRRKGLTT